LVFTTAAYEMVTTLRLFTLCREDTRTGYEVSNHYYLVEKVIDCEWVMKTVK